MYIVTVIGKCGTRRQYGFSKVKDASFSAVRHSKNGAIAVWIESLSEWTSIYNPVREQFRRDKQEVVHG